MKNKSDIGKRLKEARDFRDMTQVELAKASGVEQANISKLERGVQKSSTELPELAHALQISAIWLAQGTGTMISDKNDVIKRLEESNTDDVMLYQFGDLRCTNSLQNASKTTEKAGVWVSKHTLSKLRVDENTAIGFIQKDESMVTTLTAEDEGIIDTTQNDVSEHSGRLFAIAVGGNAAIVRRITSRTTGGCVITCDNNDKSRFPDEILTSEDMNSLVVIGRLRWSSGVK